MKYTIAGNLVITDRESFSKDALVIKWGNAFAPTHPTTELCLKLMERVFSSRMASSILDIGCGSGILALAGLKLGAKRAIALDISRVAVRATWENARRNNLESNLDLILGSIESVKGSFDLIVANLRLPILQGMADSFRGLLNTGGTLVLSGFYDIEFPHLQSGLLDLGFRCGDVLFKDYVMIDLPASMSSTFGAAQFYPDGGALK